MYKVQISLKTLSRVFVLAASPLLSGMLSAEVIKVKIPQMMCVPCRNKITKTLNGQAGVSNVKVELPTKTATFVCNKAKGCSKKDVLSALAAIKYPGTEVAVQ